MHDTGTNSISITEMNSERIPVSEIYDRFPW